MPKRVLDFDALWASDKIAACCEVAQVEYAWLYGAADANGSFELTNLRVLWSKAYAIRKDFPFERFERVIQEFNAKGLLFIWTEQGKRYGHWTGSDKKGRLPRESRRTERYGQILAPPVPKDQLQIYVTRCASHCDTKTVADNFGGNTVAGNCDSNAVALRHKSVDGLGLGLGVGVGVGVGVKPRRQKAAPGDPRFQPFFTFAFDSFNAKYQRKPLWRGKDQNGLRSLLVSHNVERLPLNRLQSDWRSFLDSTDPFILKQGGSLAFFCSCIDKFANGPLLAASQKGKSNGKLDPNEAAAITMRGFAANSGPTH